jgi:hypothetical protein
MDAHNPLGPDSVAGVIHAFRERLEREESRARGTDRALLTGQVRAVDGLWDILARHGAAAPRPRPGGLCPEGCDEDGHYLTIRMPLGSMHHTVHVEAREIARLNQGEGPKALERYRQIAQGSLLRIEPPDRPRPSPAGLYLVTPPGAATVSAPSVAEITEAMREQAERYARMGT